MRSRSERQLLKDFRQGRRNGYEQAVCRYYKDVYRFLVYLTGDIKHAEDLTQETFASAWKKVNSYEGRSSFKTWLYRIAYNKFVDLKRKEQRYNRLIEKMAQNDFCREGFDPLSRIQAKERSGVLYEAIHKLETAERAVIVLHYIQGMSFRKMVMVLDEPVGTIKWRTSKALKKLRDFLGGRV